MPGRVLLEAQLLLPKCGTQSGCHTTAVPFPPDFKAPGVWRRLLDVPAKNLCKASKYIDSADPAKSFIVAKIKGAKSAELGCPRGGGAAGAGGTTMPFTMDPLPADEIACVEAYAWAVSGRAR